MYLLDTCTFLWCLEGDERLSDRAKNIITTKENLYLSHVSLWEIAIKKTIKKLRLNRTTLDLENVCRTNRIELIPIKPNYFDTIQELPYHHGDPFDRLIMATAIEEGLILITNDEKIRLYQEVRQLW